MPDDDRPASASAGSTRRGRPGRHRLLPHTADLGLEASSSSLAGAFEAAGRALAEVAGEAPAGTAPAQREHVELTAPDLEGLAFAWLNELIGVVEAHRGAIVDVAVRSVRRTADGSRLVADVGLAPFDGTAVRPRQPVKSATFHRLRAERTAARWTLTAYLDL